MKAQIVNNFAEAFKCGSGLCIIDSVWPSFDASDRAYFTPVSDRYIEAERLPPDWLALVGKTVCADRTTVGTIADLLEELPPDVGKEWCNLYARLNDDGGDATLDAFEEAHHIRWYGEGYYLDDGQDGEGEDNAGLFALKNATPAELSAEKERQRQREEIARRIARPLKGGGPVNVQSQFDFGQTGQMDLFAPIMEKDEKQKGKCK